MLELHGKSCIDMLRDIVSQGKLNPSEFPIVTRENGKLVVLEGNRRLTALKLWRDPSVLDSSSALAEKYGKRVERAVLSSRYSPIETIFVHEVSSRNEARHWIAIKHESGQGGRATSRWNALMQESFTAEEDPAKRPVTLAFVDFVQETWPEDSTLKESLNSCLSRYTNLQRVIKKPLVRDYLGLSFEHGSIIPLYPKDALLPLVRRLIEDLAREKSSSGDSWSRIFNLNKDAKKYFEETPELFAKNLAPKLKQPLPESANNRSTAQPQSSNIRTTSEPPRKASHSQELPPSTNSGQGDFFPDLPQSQKRRKVAARYIFRGVPTDFFPDRLGDLIRQTSQLPVDDYHEVLAGLIRQIVDLTTAWYLEKYKPNSGGTIEARVRKVILLVDPDAENLPKKVEEWTELQKLLREANKDNGQALQLGVHSWRLSNSPNEVYTRASLWTPLLVSMGEKLRQNQQS